MPGCGIADAYRLCLDGLSITLRRCVSISARSGLVWTGVDGAVPGCLVTWKSKLFQDSELSRPRRFEIT